MRRMQLALLTGFMAMVVMPLVASADVILSLSPDQPSVTGPSATTTLTLFMATDVGTSTDNATWSVGCDSGCAITNFVFTEAYGPGSGLVQFGANKTTNPFALGGTQTNLNTSGSGAAQGDGLGTVIGDGSFVGSIGFITATLPLNGDGNAYNIGTVTVHLTGAGGIVTPFFRPGEGIFNLAPSVPTQFQSATIGVPGVPEPGTASLLALGLGGLALLGRRNRS